MNTAQIDQQISQVRQQRLQAELAETARLQAEQENQRQIDHANMQLAALERQKANAKFDEAVQYNVTLVNQNAAACSRLLTALNAAAQAFRDHIGNTPRDVDETFITQQRHGDNAIGLKIAASGVERNATNSMDYIRGAMDVQQAAINQLPNAMAMDVLLAGWIAQAQSEQERQLRAGFALIMTGQEISPPKEFNTTVVNDSRIQARRNAGGSVQVRR